VRTMEGTQARAPHPQEPAQAAAQPAAVPTSEGAPPQPGSGSEGQPGDAPRRRRRRRRGRRGPGLGAPVDATTNAAAPAVTEEGAALEDGDTDADEGFEEETGAAEPESVPLPVPLD